MYPDTNYYYFMKRTILTFLLVFCTLIVTAGKPLSFAKYQVEEGLSHNTVWCVLQDSYGFMWFGTRDGLNCFDGKNFRIYRNDAKNSFSLGNNYVRALFEDEEHNLWIGTNKGLYIFNRKTETFSFFSERTEDGVLISSNVNKIIKSNNGDIWIATLGQGIFIYQPAKDILVQNTQYTSFVWNLLKTPSGNILATSRENGVIYFDKSGRYLRSFIPNDRNNIDVEALCYHNNTLWFGMGADGFYKLDLKTGRIESINKANQAVTVSNIRKIFPYSKDELWVGGDNGLYLYSIKTNIFTRIDDPSNPKSLSDQSIYDIFRDREGGLWVSTYFGGVNYLPKNSKPFEHYFPLYKSGSLTGKAISQFCEDKTGNIWIATEDGGLNYFNTKTLKTEDYSSLSTKNNFTYHNIHSLMLDGEKLWIGTFSRGIDVLDLKTKTLTNYKHSRFDTKSICDNAIYALYKDSRGDIWVGTAWGLSKFNRSDNSFTLVSEIGGMAHIFDIKEDSRGFLWFATYNTGVFRLNPYSGNWKHFTHIIGDPNSIVGNNVISLFEDNRHTMWFGTEGNGLCYFDNKLLSFVPFDPENNILPNPVIYSIEQDEFSNFWIASNAGLVRINPYTKKNPTVFTKTDGLQSNQFNFRSSLKAKDGKLYFGGINGFNAFFPKTFTENKYVPIVRISDFRLFNKSITMNDEDSPLKGPIYELKKLKLKYNQNTFSFSFVSMSYQAPDKNQFIYKMDGVDKNWISVENGKNTAYYTNLSPGTYTFRVKGTNNDGVWSKEEAVLKVRILPPFWKSWVALLLYFALIVFAIIQLFKWWRSQLSREHNERLKEYHVQQEKESYLSKINFFTNLAHEIRTPLTLIKLPLDRIISSGDGNTETKKYLSTIDKNADYLLNLINQLLDFRKTEEVEFKLHPINCTINELARDNFGRFKLTAQIKGIEFELLVPDVDLISAVDPEAFSKIISNLLSNALKYAKSKIGLKLKVFDNHFELSIYDDGKGILEVEKNRIFDFFYQTENSEKGTGIGLAFARTLTEKHNGTLEQFNNEKGGSTFIISIPIKTVNQTDKTSALTQILDEYPLYSSPLTETENIIQNSLNTVHLLLVEDNTELLHLTADYLKDFYQVHLACNGKEALTVVVDETIDIIVSDIMMPEMDGYQLCEAIKSDTNYCHIPIILLTAKTTIEAKIQGLEYGSDAYLEKPFSLEHLRTQINNLLHSRQQLRDLFASSPLLPNTDIAVTQKDKDFVERLNVAIESHLQDINFSIDTLSEILFMSRSNFYRKIKSISGMSPNDYLKMIRLKKAAELLLKQEYRINEVYEQVGFSSSSYFAKCFKEQFSILPRDFVLNAGRVEPTTKKTDTI